MHSLRALAGAALLTAVPAFLVTVFQAQSSTLFANVSEQLTALRAALSAASAAGSDLLICPELYTTGYGLGAPLSAEPRGGRSYTAAAAMAAAANVALVYTYTEDGGDGRLYDAAAVFSRGGAPLADYRKVNLAAGEDLFLTPGSGAPPVVELLDGAGVPVRVGVLICFDIYLPEPARQLALQRVDVIAVPTANGYPPGVYNSLTQLVVPTRALENNAFVVYTNWYQVRGGSGNSSFPEIWSFFGQSAVADGGGNLLYQGPADGPALAHVLLNFTGRVPGSTAIGRAAADLIGLCSNVSAA